jgi:hypothetical protein
MKLDDYDDDEEEEEDDDLEDMSQPAASRPWCQAPIWSARPDFYCQTGTGLLLWSDLSGERTGL